MSTALAPAIVSPNGIAFFDPDQFAHAQRVAQLFANSALAPQAFQGNIANCTIALDIAARTGSSPMAVMQNLNIIHGKPSWSSQYIIASLLACGRFTPLRYEMRDLGPIDLKGVKTENKGCIAYAWEKSIPEDKRTRENRLESPEITVAMAIQEGWWSKNGSKWPIMTDLMLRYRGATLFGRMYAPDILMGMQAQEEVQDIIDIDPLPARDEKKVLALEEKLGGSGESEQAASGRRKRGVAATKTVDATPESAPTSPPPVESSQTSTSESTSAGVSNPPATESTATAPAQPAPAQTEAPAPATTALSKVRTSVKKTEQVQTPAPENKLFTKVQLEGEEFTGEAYFEAPLIKFAPDGVVIDAMMERRPHKTKPGVFINVIASYEIVGG